MSASEATAPTTVPEVSKEKKPEAEPEKKTTEVKESPKSSPTKAETAELSSALQLLAAGKRNFLVSDINGAVECLADACQKFGEYYGEGAKECGDAYFYYGKALLELARMENGVIDKAMDGVPLSEDENDDSKIEDPSKCTDEEKQEIEEQVGKALEENCETLSKAKKEGDDKEEELSDKERAAMAEDRSKTPDEEPAKDGEKEEEKKSASPDSKDKSKDDKSPADKSKGAEGKDEDEKKGEDKSKDDKSPVDKSKGDKSPAAEGKDEDEKKGEDKSPAEKAKSAENSSEVEKKADDKEKASKKKDDSAESAEDEDEEEESAAAAPAEGEEEKKEGDTEEEEEGDEEEGEEKADNESIGSNDAGTSQTKDSTDKNAVEQEEEEDLSNLQLSWEMLELAKNCFRAHADSLPSEDKERMDLENKLSETHQLLGELSIENEDYETAIKDLGTCLRRRQELLPGDSRSIAETHYQMGVAFGFGLKFSEAGESLREAIAVLEKRIDNLKENKASKVSLNKDPFYTPEKEIEELSKLIPEIKEKIADTEDMAKESVKRIGDKMLMEGEEVETAVLGETAGKTANGKGGKSSNGFGKENGETNGKAVSDISHMMKKKRKPEEASAPASSGDGEASEVNGTEPKKPHLDASAPAPTA